MKYLIVIAAAAVMTVGTAVAEPHEGAGFIRDYDANGDGKVTRAEFDAGRAARFTTTDANKDGTVSEEEYVGEYNARLEARLAKSDLSADLKTEERQRQIRQAHVRFKVLDKSKDAKLQEAEYDVSGARAFAEQDADKDNVISAADATLIAANKAAAKHN